MAAAKPSKKILAMRDKTESYKIDKGEELWPMPFRLLICGASERSGKSTLVANLILRPEFYGKDFAPENIYIISPSARRDEKWRMMIDRLEIPAENIMTEFDEDKLDAIYQIITEEHAQSKADGETPEHWLMIFDDLSYTGELLRNETVQKLICNGRHMLISQIYTAQKYTQLDTCVRENVTGAIFYSCTEKQMRLIADDFNQMKSKKLFIEEFLKATEPKHGIFIVNQVAPRNKRYRSGFGDDDIIAA